MAVPTLWADRQTLAWVSGTIFGRDVLPDVNRIKASSVPDAKSSSLMRRFAPPVILKGPNPPRGGGGRSTTCMPSASAAARLAEFMSRRVNSADTLSSAK